MSLPLISRPDVGSSLPFGLPLTCPLFLSPSPSHTATPALSPRNTPPITNPRAFTQVQYLRRVKIRLLVSWRRNLRLGEVTDLDCAAGLRLGSPVSRAHRLFIIVSPSQCRPQLRKCPCLCVIDLGETRLSRAQVAFPDLFANLLSSLISHLFSPMALGKPAGPCPTYPCVRALLPPSPPLCPCPYVPKYPSEPRINEAPDPHSFN